jgi:hypothetical protein
VSKLGKLMNSQAIHVSSSPNYPFLFLDPVAVSEPLTLIKCGDTGMNYTNLKEIKQ